MKLRVLKVCLAVAASLCALAASWSWAISSPVGSSPDEGFHLVSIWCGPDELIVDCKEDPNNPNNYLVPGLMGEPWLCFYGRSDQSAGCQAENTAGRRISTSGFNTTEYPPHYYDLAREFVEEDIVSSVVLIRRSNAFVAVALVALALSLHRKRGWFLASLHLVLAVPLATFFVPSVNPTGLAIAGVSAFTLATSSLLQRQENLLELAFPGLILVLASIVAFSSRRDSIAYCVLLGVAALVIDGSTRFDRRVSVRKFLWGQLHRPAVLGTIVIVAFFGIMFLRSGIGSVVTSGLDGDVENRDPFTVLISNLMELPTFFGGFFSGPGWGLGWLDTPMPLVVPLGAALATFGLFKTSLMSSTILERVIFSALMAIVSVLALTALQADLRFVGETVQPRYLYPLFVGAFLLISTRTTTRPTRSVLVVSIAAIIFAHSVALRTNIRRYTTGLDVRSWQLNEPVEWWWSTGPSPSTTWLTGSIFFGLAIVLCALGTRTSDAIQKG